MDIRCVRQRTSGKGDFHSLSVPLLSIQQQQGRTAAVLLGRETTEVVTAVDRLPMTVVVVVVGQQPPRPCSGTGSIDERGGSASSIPVLQHGVQ